MSKNQVNLDHLRHSTAHLLAAAVIKLWPTAKRAIGPAIDNGFYFDFDFGKVKISEADFPKIEETMRQILPSWQKFTRHDLTAPEAEKEYPHNPYKHEMIAEFSGQGKNKVSFYKSGSYWDLCRGGHVDHPDQQLKYFKLLSIAGAYWRGDEKNQMLTRIYGTAFPSQKDLDKYLWQQDEAKKRDHRKLSQQLDLFHFQAEAPGMAFWHPKGMILRNQLINFSRQLQLEYGYQEILTPILIRQNIFKQSGHWDHYKDDMFFTHYQDKQDLMALKPMNCPGMIQVYKSSPKSYRDLPLKLSEYGIITRKEQPGELSGLFRVMQACQDDAHLFTPEDKIPQVVHETIELVQKIYSPFGLKYQAFLSTRPDKFMGQKSTWDKAEAALKQAMKAANLPVTIKDKEGAFYGPKIDYDLEDSLGRKWQCATIQLDFQMPQAFKLQYTGTDGQAHQPVIIHRTIMGSIERFIGILIEHYAGAFPVWLAPVQAVILPISEKHSSFARGGLAKLNQAGIRVELDDRSESLQKRIREAELQKVPYMLILGDKEAKSDSVSVRQRGEKDLGSMSVKKFLQTITQQIIDKKF